MLIYGDSNSNGCAITLKVYRQITYYKFYIYHGSSLHLHTKYNTYFQFIIVYVYFTLLPCLVPRKVFMFIVIFFF